jgi:protein gp37
MHPKADFTWKLLSRYYGGGGFDPTGSQSERERNSSLMLKIDWLVAGCESTSHTTPGRPAELDWFQKVRDECERGGIPYWLKQISVDGRLVHAPMLDGKQWQQIPEVTQ